MMKYAYILAGLMLFGCSGPKPIKVTERLFVLPTDKGPYWPFEDTVTVPLKKRVSQGYAETFRVNETRFRFVRDTLVTGLYDLQSVSKDHWVTNLSLRMPLRNDKFFLNIDFDLDGFHDLSFPEFENTVVYFFNKEKLAFDTSPVKFVYDYALLDREKLIYGSNTKRPDPYSWNIDIFSIAGRTKKYLLKAHIQLKRYTRRAGYDIIDASIYRCHNGSAANTTYIETIDIRKPYTDFSLRDFMIRLAHDKRYL